jgi:glycosyltransferase involved in cell wall biosynthesis
VFHYSVWSEAAAYVQGLKDARVLLVYHNITPTEWFAGVNPQAERDTRLGRERLVDLARRSVYATGMSEYSRRELEEAGFAATGVVPILVDFDGLARRLRAAPPRPADGYARVLSVGRLAPNKRHEDTLKLFYHYKRHVNPRSRLTLIGFADTGSYRDFLDRLARRLGLDPHVELAGHVSDDELARHYAWADAYVTMSEHEGFCVPPLEAMAAGIPVLAFAATAVPFTLGDAGVLMERKDPAVGGELLGMLCADTPLRRRLVVRGGEHVLDFSAERTRARFVEAVARAAGLPAMAV